jgi:hypothetical protein
MTSLTPAQAAPGELAQKLGPDLVVFADHNNCSEKIRYSVACGH